MKFLDASVLGEWYTPAHSTPYAGFGDEDGAVLDEEEARQNSAGPEMLLKQLKDMLNRDGATASPPFQTASTRASSG